MKKETDLEAARVNDTGPKLSVPPEIRTSDRSKLVIVYVRQSTPRQVQENTGSTATQRELAELPLRWGWSESRIITIDDDLGVSGRRLEGRSGFLRMCESIENGEVAIVMAAEVDRLSRDKYAAQYFLRRARKAGVVLWAKGKFYDVAGANLAELFGLEIE